MKLPFKLSRRQFIYGSMAGLPTAAAADTFLIEPTWLAVNRVKLSESPTTRIVQFSDVHHKGDRKYFEKVIETINGLEPDVVCFTGDLIERRKHLAEALELIGQIKAPVVGIPGNHDYWARVEFSEWSEPFRKTGGAFLMDEAFELKKHNLRFIGLTGGKDPKLEPKKGKRNILLTHYPAHVKEMRERKFDLMLAGHSHGGQIRIPFIGAPILPWRVDEYDLGYFDTKWGPLYVSSGIGYFYINVRFNCRPEVTLLELKVRLRSPTIRPSDERGHRRTNIPEETAPAALAGVFICRHPAGAFGRLWKPSLLLAGRKGPFRRRFPNHTDPGRAGGQSNAGGTPKETQAGA